MANTPNMNLTLPGIGTTSAPVWASQLNGDLQQIDTHNHATGGGVQINPNGININAALPFNSNSATGLLSCNFNSQSSTLGLTNALYFSGGNLYAADGSSNQVQITSGGNVKGTAGSIGSLANPAAATYSGSPNFSFSWTSQSNQYAAMLNGAVSIFQTNVASSSSVTIAANSGQTGSYQLTLPASLPSSPQYLTSDTSGNLSFSTSNNIAAGATRAVGTSVGTNGVAISTSSGAFSTSATSLTPITNLSVTIITSGRPVYLSLSPDGNNSGHNSLVQSSQSGSSTVATSQISFLRGGTQICAQQIGTGIATSNINPLIEVPPGSFQFVDNVGAGTYTYSVQGLNGSGSALTVNYCTLVAYEL